MQNKKLGKKISCMVLLPVSTAAYLDREVEQINQLYGCRSGKASLLRACADAIAAAKFPAAEAGATPYYLTRRLIQALGATEQQEVK